MSTIIPDTLFLGAIGHALDESWLASHAIDTVITVLRLDDADDEAVLASAVAAAKVRRHIVLPVDDVAKTDLSVHFEAVHRAIGAAEGRPVLVHCYMGISRSATVVLAHLMRARRISLAEAVKRVVAARPVVFPNDGFIDQLIDDEIALFGTSSVLEGNGADKRSGRNCVRRLCWQTEGTEPDSL